MGRKKKKRTGPLLGPSGYGFDFGERPKYAAVPNPEFNQALMDANVIGCAYGFGPAEGFRSAIPLLTLVGTDEGNLKAAFEHFRDWGCEEDGDAVDIHLLLSLDGSYRMWLGPETRRLLFRCIPQADLVDPLIFNVSWIKQFDSTNPYLFQLREYLKGNITPVSVSAATVPKAWTSLAPTDISGIEGLPKLIKFNLEIIAEQDSPDDLRFKPLITRPRGPQGDGLPKPNEYADGRKRTFDVAFPVLRERVRRANLLSQVHSIEGFDDVKEDQVIQAAINLVLSDELAPGDQHYKSLKDARADKIWELVTSRREWADEKNGVPELESEAIARQIELDVRYVLTRRGVPTSEMQFRKLQQMFLRKGYVA
jgi:hypothetical protein